MQEDTHLGVPLEEETIINFIVQYNLAVGVERLLCLSFRLNVCPLTVERWSRPVHVLHLIATYKSES